MNYYDPYGGQNNGQPPYQPRQYSPQPYQPQQYQHYQPQYQPLPPRQLNEKPLRQNGNRIGMALLLQIAIVFPLVLLGDYLVKQFSAHTSSTEWISFAETLRDSVCYVFMMGVPLLIAKWWIGVPSHVAYPIKRPNWKIAIPAVFVCLGSVIIGTLLSGGLSVLIEAVFHLRPTWPGIPTPIGIPATVLYFIEIAVLPAVFEEMLFRGVIMQSLRRFGDVFALVVSAILFALAHQNLIQGPNAFVLGLVIGYFVMRTGSLWTGMIIHFANNGIIVVFGIWTDTLPQRQADAAGMLLYVVYGILALVALAYLILTQTNMFKLAPSTYPLSAGKKGRLVFLSAGMVLYTLLWIVVICMQFERTVL